jgi:DNA-binding LacI/PurR family transcriptional regulator
MNSAQVETRYLNSFMARQADGLIVVPSEQTTDLRAAAEVATVVVDRRVDGVDFVGSDHQGGARQAIEYLIELGHQRIGCIAGPRELASSYERYQGFTDVMTTRLGMTKRSLGPLTRFADFDTAGGRSAARELLSLPQPPTALFAASDQQAVGALNEAVDRGVRVPQDLSVVGFDDIPLARLWSPRLTTVAQPIAEIGARAVEMLLERRQHSGAPRSDVLATQLQIRESAQGP